MTINSDRNLDTNRIEESREQQIPVQNRIQQQIVKDAVQGETSPQQQMMQLFTSAPNLNVSQQTAQSQIQKGYLDVKV